MLYTLFKKDRDDYHREDRLRLGLNNIHSGSETSIITLSDFTYAMWEFVVFYQYSCEGTLMIATTVTEICMRVIHN